MLLVVGLKAYFDLDRRKRVQSNSPHKRSFTTLRPGMEERTTREYVPYASVCDVHTVSAPTPDNCTRCDRTFLPLANSASASGLAFDLVIRVRRASHWQARRGSGFLVPPVTVPRRASRMASTLRRPRFSRSHCSRLMRAGPGQYHPLQRGM